MKRHCRLGKSENTTAGSRPAPSSISGHRRFPERGESINSFIGRRLSASPNVENRRYVRPLRESTGSLVGDLVFLLGLLSSLHRWCVRCVYLRFAERRSRGLRASMRIIAFTAVLTSLNGCGSLPSSGPTANDIENGRLDPNALGFKIIDITAAPSGVEMSDAGGSTASLAHLASKGNADTVGPAMFCKSRSLRLEHLFIRRMAAVSNSRATTGAAPRRREQAKICRPCASIREARSRFPISAVYV